ncbi:hypothetical protein OUZ56_015594 [Daphnia magna]|uniref:Major facilitator superfamily (MFS) profile domain-containing protein n=1 Tax=Daphnia magna TaxID=35525 RepID=A0ABR0AN89_9CRUS|nr:hypothetical protein OUZ56_015594 [Daphnia magna]
MEENGEKGIAEGSEIKKKGKALLIYDLKQRKLIPTKILFFVVLSSIGVLLPYMTIHMKSLGISVEETALIYGIFPLFAILAPYTMGIIADKLGNFKVLLCVTMLMAMANALLFLVIPTGRFIEKYPVNLTMAVGCGEDGRLVLTDLDSKTCGFRNTVDGNLSLAVTECGYICYDEIHQKSQLKQEEEQTSSLPADWPSADQPFKKFRHGMFFQDNWGLEISCSGISPSLAKTNCSLNRNESPRINATFKHVTIRLNNDNGDFPIERTLFNGVFPLSNGLECSNSYDQPIKLVQPLVFTLNGTLKLGDDGVLSPWNSPGENSNQDRVVYRTCRSQCVVQTNRKNLCSDVANVIVYDPQLTFWLYLLLRLFFAVLLGGYMVLFEGACLAVVIQYKGDLGLQRMFGILGTMIFCPVSGALIDYFSINQDIPDYRPAFYLYAILVGSAALGVLTVDLDFRPPAKELLKDIKSILKNLELVVFFIVIFTSGLFWGYIESYLFWFLEEMGGTKSLMGLTVTVSSLFGIPALIFSDVIFRKIGHPNVQIIGFAFYVIRLIGYSYIYNPYMCLIYEALEAITTSLMMTSAVAYSAELSTTTTLATIQGMVGGTYYGIGRGLGSLVGGFLMKYYGTRATFRILGVGALFVGVLYFFFNVFYIRRRHLNREKIEKKMPDEPDIVGKCGVDHGLNNPVFIPDDDVPKSSITKKKGKSID